MAEIFYLPSQRLDFLYDEQRQMTFIKSSLQVYLFEGEYINTEKPTFLSLNAPSYEYSVVVTGERQSLAGHWWLGEVLIPVSDKTAYDDLNIPLLSKIIEVHEVVTIPLATQLQTEYFFVKAVVNHPQGSGDVSNHIKKDGNVEID